MKPRWLNKKHHPKVHKVRRRWPSWVFHNHTTTGQHTTVHIDTSTRSARWNGAKYLPSMRRFVGPNWPRNRRPRAGTKLGQKLQTQKSTASRNSHQMRMVGLAWYRLSLGPEITRQKIRIKKNTTFNKKFLVNRKLSTHFTRQISKN